MSCVLKQNKTWILSQQSGDDSAPIIVLILYKSAHLITSLDVFVILHIPLCCKQPNQTLNPTWVALNVISLYNWMDPASVCCRCLCINLNRPIWCRRFCFFLQKLQPLNTSVFRLSSPVKRACPLVMESLLAAVIAATSLDVHLGGIRQVHV